MLLQQNEFCRIAGATPGDADILPRDPDNDGTASSEAMPTQSQTTMMFSDSRRKVAAQSKCDVQRPRLRCPGTYVKYMMFVDPRGDAPQLYSTIDDAAIP